MATLSDYIESLQKKVTLGIIITTNRTDSHLIETLNSMSQQAEEERESLSNLKTKFEEVEKENRRLSTIIIELERNN